jgi:hypothetical protein
MKTQDFYKKDGTVHSSVCRQILEKVKQIPNII